MRRGYNSLQSREEGGSLGLLDSGFEEVGGLEEDGGGKARAKTSSKVKGCF